MIVYQHDKAGFCRDVETGDIDRILLDRVRGALGIGVSLSEVRSWHQSLTHMHLVLGDPEIPEDAGVGIEFQIPQTAKRIDVLLSGRNDEPRDQAVIASDAVAGLSDSEASALYRRISGISSGSVLDSLRL